MKGQFARRRPALCHRAMISSLVLLLGLGCTAGGCDATPAQKTTTPEVAPPSIENMKDNIKSQAAQFKGAKGKRPAGEPHGR
jgi:hypothetical protein